MGYLRVLIISLSLIAFTISCDVASSDGEEDNQDEGNQEEVEEDPPEYSTEEEVEEHISGMYSDVSHEDYYGFNFIVMTSLSSDIVELTATGTSENIEALREFDKYEVDSESPILESFWNKSYEIIQKGDTLVTYLPDSDLDQEFIDKSVGEVQFLKALVYFDLVRSFGGIPINSMDEENPIRLTREESFAEIIDLLHRAIDHSPSFTESSSGSREAALALLVRCYIYLGEWNEAVNIASDIVEDESFSITEEYQSIFDNPNNPEVIFSLELNNNKLANWFTPEEEGGIGNLAIHQEFGNAMTDRENDARNQLIYHGENSRYSSLKFNIDGSVYLPILRLSEVQLLFAEALVQLGETAQAREYINELRERADLEPITTTESSALEGTISFERAVEFFGEGQRWFDLVRIERATEVLEDVLFYDDNEITLEEEYRQLFPIPHSVMENNPNLEQNPGYQ